MPASPIHPGDILADALSEIGVTAAELARQTNVPANRISQIVNGKRRISGDTALRLGHWFGTGARFRLNLQSAHDLEVATAAVGKAVSRLPQRSAA